MPKVFAGNYADIFDIKGKKAVVVGGAGGFGKEIAKAFAQRGVDVLISSRREDALKAACEDIKAGAAAGVKVTYFAGDAGDEETVKAAALSVDKVQKATEGMQIVKTILVKNRLINLIVKPR